MAFGGGNQSQGLDFSQLPSAKSNPWGPDILHNLFDQVEETAKGVATAPWYIGKTLLGDTKNYFTGEGDFEFDDLVKDIAKTTVRDIKYRWKPLVQGDFGKWWDHVEKDPLGTALDVATIVTLGGAGAGKAGVAAAKAGNADSIWVKAAGLEKAGRHIDDLAKDSAAMRGLDAGDDLGMLRSLAKSDVEIKKGVVDDLGEVWDGPAASLKVGNASVSLPLSHNPVVRARQVAVVKLGNKFPNMPGLGAAKRGTRLMTKKDRHLLDREYLRVARPAEAALDALDDVERNALSVLPWREAGVSREQARGFLQERLEKAQQALEDGAPRAELKAQALKERLQAVDDDAIWNAADPEQMSERMRGAASELSNVSKATTQRLWELAGGKTRGGQPISFEDFWALQRSREARRIQRGDDIDELDLLDDDTVNAADLAEKYKDLKYSFVRPHVLPKEFKHYGRQEMHAGRSVSARASNRAKKNEFALFDDAMDFFDPRTVLFAAKDVARYQSTVRRVNALREAGRVFDEPSQVPKDWKILENDGIGEDLRNLKNWLNEDAVVVFGKDPALAETHGVVDSLLSEVDGGVFAAPKPVADELLSEFKKVNSFIQKFDTATDTWRAMTLSLRPVWMTGNFVGQLALLLTTHGMIKGGMAYMQALRMGGKGLIDAAAPDVFSSGLSRNIFESFAKRHHGKESQASVAMRTLMGEKGIAAKDAAKSVWGLTDKMMQINAIVTDDIPRRAAFLAEIKPHVKRIQAETGMSFEEAAAKFLDNPEVVDRIAQKVMADLVDFKSLTEFERTYLRRLMPFWSWVRGATGRTWRLAMDEPWKAWAGMEGASFGADKNEELLGALPDFLQGVLPMGSVEDDSVRVVNSNSLNPFATIGDVAGMLKSATVGDVQVGGSNPASLMNPGLKSLVETFTGQDLFYGTPLPGVEDPNPNGWDPADLLPPGYAGRLGERLVSSFPQQRLFERLTGTGVQGNASLYDDSTLDTLLSYFAFPTKRLNVDQANARASQQREGGQYTVI